MHIYNMTNRNKEVVKRFTIATVSLLCEALAPEFANDNCSLAVVSGPPLTPETAMNFATVVDDTGVDTIYLAFEPGREHLGPVSATIIAERSGIVYRWCDCSIWAPKHGGSFLLMPDGLQLCFSHDGKALISHDTRPAQSLRNGAVRARNLISRTARALTNEQLAMAEESWEFAA